MNNQEELNKVNNTLIEALEDQIKILKEYIEIQKKYIRVISAIVETK